MPYPVQGVNCCGLKARGYPGAVSQCWRGQIQRQGLAVVFAFEHEVGTRHRVFDGEPSQFVANIGVLLAVECGAVGVGTFSEQVQSVGRVLARVVGALACRAQPDIIGTGKDEGMVARALEMRDGFEVSPERVSTATLLESLISEGIVLFLGKGKRW